MNLTDKKGAITVFIPHSLGIFSKSLDPMEIYQKGVSLTGGEDGETFVGTLNALEELGLGDIVSRVMNVAADMKDRSTGTL